VKGKLSAVRYLLDEGADVNASINGNTALTERPSMATSRCQGTSGARRERQRYYGEWNRLGHCPQAKRRRLIEL